MDLVEEILAGNKRAAAKAISVLEDGDPEGQGILRRLFRHTGRAHVVGVSGPPGSGKSSIIYRLAREYRKRGKRVGIVAVDPTSPITGGALLGDRIRMGDLTSDPEVFIRSMGTRGHLGGLASATAAAIKVLDAWGSDVILVETAGAGQSDVEVSGLVHTTLIVEMPGAGDEVQVMKAGILEVGDVFVVNKGDLEGAEGLARELKASVEMGAYEGWVPKVTVASALEGRGIPELVDMLQEHRTYLETSGELGRKRETQAVREVLEAVREEALHQALEGLPEEELKGLAHRVASGDLDLHEAAVALLRRTAARRPKPAGAPTRSRRGP